MISYFKYEDFDYDNVVKINKGYNSDRTKYRDVYGNTKVKGVEVYYNINGKIIAMYFYEDKKKHREDGPAVVKFGADKKVFYEGYYQHGLFHKLDGPAEVWYNYRGEVLEEKYYLNGVYHRIDGPAIYEFDWSNMVKKYVWYKNGKIHRDDGPAEYKVNVNTGVLMSEVYYKNGVQTRGNGLPAVTKRYKNGLLNKVVYEVNGKKHREDGPAVIHYRKTGKILKQSFFVKGKIDRTREYYCEEFYIDGTLKKVSQLLDDHYSITKKFYRDGKTVRKLVCMKDSKKHNPFGPSEAEFNEAGELINEKYFLEDKQLDDFKFMIISARDFAEKEEDVFGSIIEEIMNK